MAALRISHKNGMSLWLVPEPVHYLQESSQQPMAVLWAEAMAYQLITEFAVSSLHGDL